LYLRGDSRGVAILIIILYSILNDFSNEKILKFDFTITGSPKLMCKFILNIDSFQIKILKIPHKNFKETPYFPLERIDFWEISVFDFLIKKGIFLNE